MQSSRFLLHIRLALVLGLIAGGLYAFSSPAAAQVTGQQKVTEGTGGFTGTLEEGDFFGKSMAHLGDILGDDRPELAVGAYQDDVNGTMNVGSVWIMSLNDNGTVETQTQITNGSGGFAGTLAAGDEFGVSVASLGTINGSPVLAVGARYDDDGGTGDSANRGAVWILFLNSNGTVSSHQKISDTEGGFTGGLGDTDKFGQAVGSVGDMTGDGIPELAVGASGLDNDRGGVWILSLNQNGAVQTSEFSDGYTLIDQNDVPLNEADFFGFSIAHVGDLSGTGTRDLAIGAFKDDETGTDAGAVWVVRVNDDGTVVNTQKINGSKGSFSGSLQAGDSFGSSVAALGDLNTDGVPDLAVGAFLDDDNDAGASGDTDRGAVWILYMTNDGTVADHKKISDTAGGFGGTLQDGDLFGISVASLGDLDGNSVPDLAVGALGAGNNTGAFWTLFGNQALLPVELAAFEATKAGENAVHLTWTTASETNNAGFRIQHAQTGEQGGSVKWEKIGFMESQASGGTSTRSFSYRFTAKGLSAGLHQFRLQQVDLDGTTHLHEPVTVELSLQEALRLSAPAPNPARNRATLSFAVKKATRTEVTLYNVLGQEMATLYEGTPRAGEPHTLEVSATKFPSGVYLVRLQSGQQSRTERLTIVR